MDGAKKHGEIVGLDLLRFLCALLVVSFHLGLWCFVSSETYIGTSHGAFGHILPPTPLLPFANVGWIGVQIFFVLSGFVIAYSSNGSSLSKFVRSRTVRLLPAIWICATMTAALYLGAHLYRTPIIIEAYFRSIILFPKEPWVDGVYWTLTTEVSFYCFVAILLFTDLFRKAELIFSVIGLVSAGAWLALFFMHHPIPWPVFQEQNAYMQYRVPFADLMYSQASRIDLLSYGCFFASGVILWLGATQGFSIRRLVVLTVITAGCAANIIEMSSLIGAATVPVLPPLLLYGGAIIVIVASVRFNSVFRRYSFRELGLATYPLYLFHNISGSYLFGHVLFPFMSPKWASLLSAVICIGVVLWIIRPMERVAASHFRKIVDLFAESVSVKIPFMDRMARPTTMLK